MKDDFILLLLAYNEQKNLSKVIHNLKKIVSIKRLILADDGSTDNTSKIAKELGIKIIRNNRNTGKGYMLKKAFIIILKKFPHIKWIITCDADGQHHYLDVLEFLKVAENDPSIGIIVGRRNYRIMPIKNQVPNILTSKWCKYWLNWDLFDLQCGYRCYNTESLTLLLSYGLKSQKFDFETEILLISWLKNIKMTEIPIKTIYIKQHRKSKVIPTVDTIRWIILMFKFGFSLQFIQKIWLQRKMSYKIKVITD